MNALGTSNNKKIITETKKTQSNGALSFTSAAVHKFNKKRHPFPIYQNSKKKHQDKCMVGKVSYKCTNIGIR